MTRLLTPTVAVLFACAMAAPASADEPSGFAERVERIGKLPAELVKAKKSDGEIVEALFLAILSRLPTEKEKQTATKHLVNDAAAAKDRASAGRDLAWVLINCPESLKLHGLDKNLASSLKLLTSLTDKWEKEPIEKK